MQFYIPEILLLGLYFFFANLFWEHSKYQIKQQLKRRTKTTKTYLQQVRQLLLRTISDAISKQFQEIYVCS